MVKLAINDSKGLMLKIVSNSQSLMLKIATDDLMGQKLKIVSNRRSLMLKIATDRPSSPVAAASESKVNLLEPPVTSHGRPSQVDPRPELDVVGRVCRSPVDVRST